MTIALAADLRADVYAAVKATAASLSPAIAAVYDFAPTGALPAEFIRLDGFTVRDNSPKTDQIAEHAFEVHVFIRPVATATATRGSKRAVQVLAALHAAIMAADLQGQSARHEILDVSPDLDGATVHGMSRYTITLF